MRFRLDVRVSCSPEVQDVKFIIWRLNAHILVVRPQALLILAHMPPIIVRECSISSPCRKVVKVGFNIYWGPLEQRYSF